jgi:hypothetical protein
MTGYYISPDGKAITCARCRLTSHHPKDVENRYCGNCHIFHEVDSMRTLDQIYWDALCDKECGCKSLQEALARHPKLTKIRDGESVPLIQTDIHGATHVEDKATHEVFKIASKWGIDAEGRLAKPSEGGFGCVTESGTRISMWEAWRYYRVG